MGDFLHNGGDCLRSKPLEMRQRNAKTTSLLGGFKLIMLGEEQAAKPRADLTNGRILHRQLLLAERKPGQDIPSPRMTAVKQILPDAAKDQVVEKTSEAMAAREKARKGP